MSGEGITTIAPNVLKSIARLSCLSVDGVSRMASSSAPFSRLLNKPIRDGVEIDIEDDTVYVNLFVVIMSNVNIREISRNIQHQVHRAITDLVGMNVGKVNVHVEDVDFTDNPQG